MIKKKSFNNLNEKEKQMVLEWRNAQREFMHSTHTINLSEHLDFLRSLQERVDRCYYLVYDAGEAIGVVNLVDITDTSASLGLYAKPGLRGVGQSLMETLFLLARSKGLELLRLEVARGNTRAISLYERNGFIRQKEKEGILYYEKRLA